MSARSDHLKSTPESPISKQPLIITTDKSFAVTVPRINIYANMNVQEADLVNFRKKEPEELKSKREPEELKNCDQNPEYSRSVISEVVDLAENESEDNKVNSTDTMSNSEFAGERRIKNKELDRAMKGLFQFIEAKRVRIQELEEENKGLEDAIRAKYKDRSS